MVDIRTALLLDWRGGKAELVLHRLVFRLAARRHAARLVLVHAPGSGLGAVRVPRGIMMVSAASLLERAAQADVARRTLTAVAPLLHGPARARFPEVHGVHLGELNRLALMGSVTTLQTLCAAMQAVERGSPSLRKWVLLGHEPEMLDALAADAASRGMETRAWHARALLSKLSVLGRGRPSTAAAPPTLKATRADVLLVSWTRPMDEMFSTVEDHLARSDMVDSLRVHFGDDIGAPQDPRPRVTLLRAPAADRFGVAPVPAPPCASAGRAIPTDGANAVGTDGCFISHQVEKMERRYPSQAAFIESAARLIDEVEPRVLIVGNDRWWIGQAMVTLARARGIKTLCLQDGVSSDLAVWRWCSADRVLSNGGHLRQLLEAEGVDPGRIEEVGQPRYDGLIRYKGADATRAARARLGLPTDALVVLFPTQYDQDAGYIERVVQACLEDQEVRLLLRPHPSGATAVHEALVGAFPGRVSLHRVEPIAELVAACDLLVVESSTTALEAAILDKLVVIVNENGALPHDHVVELDPLTLHSAREIPDVIRRYRAGELTVDPVAARQAFERFCGPLDGRSGARVAASILRDATAR